MKNINNYKLCIQYLYGNRYNNVKNKINYKKNNFF